MGKQTPSKHAVGRFGCLRLLLQPSAWHFHGETPLAFIVQDAIVALNILCLFLNKLRSRVPLRCLPGGCSALALGNKRRLHNGHLFVPGNEAGLYPKSLPGFFVVFWAQASHRRPLPRLAARSCCSHPTGRIRWAPVRKPHVMHVFFPSLLYFLLFACLTAALALVRSWRSTSEERSGKPGPCLSVRGLHSLSGAGVQQVGFGLLFLKLHKSQQAARTEASGRLL